MRKIAYLRILISILLIPLLIETAFCITQSGELSVEHGKYFTTSFKLQGHRIQVDVKLNGRLKPYKFMFDTGARTLVNSGIAEELGLEKLISLPTWSPDVHSYLTNLNSIGIASANVSDMNAAIMNITEIFGIEGIDGLIGSDYMSFFKVRLDYQDQEITLSTDTGSLKKIANTHLIDFTNHLMMGAPMVPCELNNQIKVRGMIDTGSPYSFVLPLEYLDSLRASFTSTINVSVGEMAKWPMSKNEISYLTSLGNLKIGDIEILNAPVIFTDIFTVLIGKDILDEYICTIDYPHHQIQFQRQGDTKFNSDYYIMDIKLKRINNKIIVKGFWKDSPFDLAGLKVGSEILFVDNIPINDKNITEVKNLIYDSDKDEVLLKTRNNSEIQELRVNKSLIRSKIDR